MMLYHDKKLFPLFDDLENTLQDEMLDIAFENFKKTNKVPSIKIKYAQRGFAFHSAVSKMVTRKLTSSNSCYLNDAKSECFVIINFFMKVDIKVFKMYLQLRGYTLIPQLKGCRIEKLVDAISDWDLKR